MLSNHVAAPRCEMPYVTRRGQRTLRLSADSLPRLLTISYIRFDCLTLIEGTKAGTFNRALLAFDKCRVSDLCRAESGSVAQTQTVSLMLDASQLGSSIFMSVKR